MWHVGSGHNVWAGFGVLHGHLLKHLVCILSLAFFCLLVASFGTNASTIQIGALGGVLKESSFLGVKADLSEFGANGSPKVARFARQKV